MSQNQQNQKGAPQDTAEMPSSGNSPSPSGSSESTASNQYKNDTGDPGRTPGSAEGVEDFQETGNE